MEEAKQKTKILKKLKNKYRLVILNDTSFEERFSYRLTPLNVVTLCLSFIVVIIVLVAFTIIFTPLRESIPGYTDVTLRQDLTKMVLRSDSLKNEIEQKDRYLKTISSILKGEKPESVDTTAGVSLNGNIEVKKDRKSKEDSMLRNYVEREDSYSLKVEKENNQLNENYFFTPLKGSVTQKFEPSNGHLAIDIVAPKNEVIKATLDGTVVFAEWTTETGNVIQLQHNNNIISIYKHNSVLLKQVGDKVRAGEAIAIIGNSGELSSGPHLHFELWQNGEAIDPSQFINFE